MESTLKFFSPDEVMRLTSGGHTFRDQNVADQVALYVFPELQARAVNSGKCSQAVLDFLSHSEWPHIRAAVAKFIVNPDSIRMLYKDKDKEVSENALNNKSAPADIALLRVKKELLKKIKNV